MEFYFDNQVKWLHEKAMEMMINFSQAKHQEDRSKVNISDDFKEEFFGLVDKVNLSLMEDKDNFFGYFLFQMSREIRFDIASPTGVNFKGANYVIYFNPLLFLKLNMKQMESTIKHEILHIVSMHLIRGNELKRSHSTLAINMAMDIVVNEYLNYLPPYATTLMWVNIKYAIDLEPYESFEYYVDKIQTAIDLLEEDEDAREEDNSNEVDQTNPEEQPHNEEQTYDEKVHHEQTHSELDNNENIETDYSIERTHDIWEESSDLDEKTQLEFTEKVIHNSEKGEIPTFLKSMISALKNSRGELPWNLYLKRLMGTIESDKKKTVTRRSRRQPERLDLRGQLRNHKANILVALDISGSISEEEFKQAIKEVLGIVKNYKHEITVIECDDEIRRVYKVKTTKDIKDRINSKGSTEFNSVFEYANQNKVNLLVYFTDGKGEDKLKTPPKGYKTLWVISGRGDHLSLKEPYGVVKKLSNTAIKDNTSDIGDAERGGYSMNHHERIL
jgi:predicted metal-dependent peptidase